MLAYLTLGSNNKEKSLEFYDAVLGELGAQRAFANDRLQFYSNGGVMIGVGTPFEGEASVGNGVMPALAAPDNETVDRVYNKAIEMGATCEGEPGQRMPIFYGAYFRDPDGNKICVCKLSQG